MQNARKDIIDFSEKGIFPYKGNAFKTKQEEEQKETITDANEFNKWVNKQETDINTELFKKTFKIQKPSDMLNYLYQANDIEKNNKIVNMINSGLKGWKKEIKEITKKERKIEKPDKMRFLSLINKNKKEKE